MKKLVILSGLVGGLFLLSFSNFALADPHLVSNPSEIPVDETRVIIDGVVEDWIIYEERVVKDINHCVFMDLASLPEGTYSVVVQFRNKWGVSSSDPFVFEKKLPDVPEGMSIISFNERE